MAQLISTNQNEYFLDVEIIIVCKPYSLLGVNTFYCIEDGGHAGHRTHRVNAWNYVTSQTAICFVYLMVTLMVIEGQILKPKSVFVVSFYTACWDPIHIQIFNKAQIIQIIAERRLGQVRRIFPNVHLLGWNSL